MTWRLCVSATLLILAAMPAALFAQRTITRAEAIEIALSHSPRGALAASDTVAANAQVRTAREYPNPTIALEYSKSVPQNHLTVDLPLELPAVRRARIRGAVAMRTGAQQAFLANRASIELDVDTLYAYARLALERLDASHETALEAGQLFKLAEDRRTAGDASDLDVELAHVSAMQLASVAARDTADAMEATLVWQAAMGVPGDSVQYRPEIGAGRFGNDIPQLPQLPRRPLVAARVASAKAAVAAAQEGLALQRTSRFGMPSLQLGIEGRDPTGADRGVLPTVGITLPLPLFHRNGGQIDAARANVDRSRAELALVQREGIAQLASAYRLRASAAIRSAQDSQAVVSANHVRMLSRTAYEEGEMAISDVLQAQRSYRDVVAQYQADLLILFVNDAIIRALTGQPVIP